MKYSEFELMPSYTIMLYSTVFIGRQPIVPLASYVWH